MPMTSQNRISALLAALSCVAMTCALPAHARQAGDSAGMAGGQEVRRFAESWYSAGKAASGNSPRMEIVDDQAAIPEIEMFVGETRVFPAPALARIAVGNGQIMSAASLDDREVIVFANAVGTSSLFIWNQDGSHRRVKINIV